MEPDDSKRMQHGSDLGRYPRFGAMIATSTVTMYAISYLNTSWLAPRPWSRTSTTCAA